MTCLIHTAYQWMVRFVSAAMPSVELLYFFIRIFGAWPNMRCGTVGGWHGLFDNWPGCSKQNNPKLRDLTRRPNNKTPNALPSNLIKIFLALCIILRLRAWCTSGGCAAAQSSVCAMCDVCDYRNITQVDVAHRRQTTTFTINKSQIRLLLS